MIVTAVTFVATHEIDLFMQINGYIFLYFVSQHFLGDIDAIIE